MKPLVEVEAELASLDLSTCGSTSLALPPFWEVRSFCAMVLEAPSHPLLCHVVTAYTGQSKDGDRHPLNSFVVLIVFSSGPL